jgi:multidrug resistance efflux pump
MKRRQKRFTTEAAIISKIDSNLKRAEWLFSESVRLDDFAVTEYHRIPALEDGMESLKGKALDKARAEIHEIKKAADKAKEQSAKHNKSRNRILSGKLPKLKNALAEFRTVTMPFCGDDKGVVLK